MVDQGRRTPKGVSRVADPAAEAGREFAEQLAAAGVTVRGEPKELTTPDEASTLAYVESPTVGVLVERMLATSDNDYAEILGRLAAAASGEPASFAGVADRAAQVLDELGVDDSGARFADASGLSRGNRLAPSTLTDLLAVTSTGYGSIHSGLPVAGATGSLAARFRTSDQRPARGVVRAKTGTLTGVSALAGYASRPDGRLLAFGFVDGSTPGGALAARAALDRAAAALVTCDCAAAPDRAIAPVVACGGPADVPSCRRPSPRSRSDPTSGPSGRPRLGPNRERRPRFGSRRDLGGRPARGVACRALVGRREGRSSVRRGLVGVRAYASHVANLVDWTLAERIGLRFMPKGPTTTPTEAHGTVAELRELAQLAREPVRALTGLDADPEHAPAVVVDRGEWIQSNIAGLGVALDPFVSARAEKEANPGIEAVGSRLTAAQLGGAMAWLSGKVLGQYEAFTAPGKPGRLLLVAPNIALVERELELVPRDFRYWVCLHEETHRAQFGGVPWLQDHFLSEVQAFVAISDLSVAEFMARLGAVAQSVVGAARGRPGPSLMEAVQTPAQREIFDRLTGLMSLLEGHADYVMDEVGPDHVPTVALIRERFAARRSQAGTVDGFVRRMMGMETKLRQYTSGADFVRAVIATAGDQGFAQVWDAPANLPSAVEIEDPAAWVRRVLG